MLFNAPLLALLAVVSTTLATPVPENHLEARVSPTNLVRINSATDYCMIVPKTKHTDIGDSEHPVSASSGLHGPFAHRLGPRFGREE